MGRAAGRLMDVRGAFPVREEERRIGEDVLHDRVELLHIREAAARCREQHRRPAHLDAQAFELPRAAGATSWQGGETPAPPVRTRACERFHVARATTAAV